MSNNMLYNDDDQIAIHSNWILVAGSDDDD